MIEAIILDGIVPQVEKTAFDVFSHSDFSLLDPYVNQVREYAKTIDRSIDTPQQRKQLASEAYKISKLKTAIEKIGANESRRVKEIPKAIDANRRLLKETLEQVQMWVREPLTEWEKIEEKKQQRLDYILGWMESRKEVHSLDINELEGSIAQISEFDVSGIDDKYIESVEIERKAAILASKNQLDSLLKQKAEREELETLRAQAEENERIAQIEKAKQEAAEKARLQAEREAEQRLEAERLRIREMELQSQREKEAQDQALRDAEDARLQAIEDARLQAESAEKARKLALEQAEQDRLAAIEAERKRVEDERLKAEAEAKARADDLAHRAKINNKAVSDIISLDAKISEDQARSVVIAIAKGLIGNVTINY